MIDQRYDSSLLGTEESIFRDYFEQLISVYGSQYEIWIRREDFNRSIAAGLVNRHSEAAVTIYLRYGGTVISDPLNLVTIERTRQHLNSGVGDLRINCLSE